MYLIILMVSRSATCSGSALIRSADYLLVRLRHKSVQCTFSSVAAIANTLHVQYYTFNQRQLLKSLALRLSELKWLQFRVIGERRPNPWSAEVTRMKYGQTRTHNSAYPARGGGFTNGRVHLQNPSPYSTVELKLYSLPATETSIWRIIARTCSVLLRQHQAAATAFVCIVQPPPP